MVSGGVGQDEVDPDLIEYVMNAAILTKCGYRCDLCLAYRENVARKDEREKLSDGWFRIYGFRIPADEIVCEGCVSGANPRLIDINCPVRPCTIAKNLSSCAECDDFVCGKLSSRIVDRAKLEKEAGRAFTEAESTNFVLPYESRPRLARLRSQFLKSR